MSNSDRPVEIGASAAEKAISAHAAEVGNKYENGVDRIAALLEDLHNLADRWGVDFATALDASSRAYWAGLRDSGPARSVAGLGEGGA